MVFRAEAGTIMSADDEGLLSAKMKDVQLSEIRKYFEENYGIVFSGQGFVFQTNITVSFERLSVEQALKRVLKKKNYAFVYNAQRELIAVTVLPGISDTPEGAINNQVQAHHSFQQKIAASPVMMQPDGTFVDEITKFNPIKAEQKEFRVQVVKDNPLFKVKINSPPSK